MQRSTESPRQLPPFTLHLILEHSRAEVDFFAHTFIAGTDGAFGNGLAIHPEVISVG